MKKYIFLIEIFFVSSFFVLIFSQTSNALAIDKACTKVESIFARGSGGRVGDDQAEAFMFFDKIDGRLKNSTSLIQTKYELGTESYGSYKYPSTDVGGLNFLNGLGAVVSGGGSFAYGDSVKQGVGELKSYLTQRYNKCKSTGTWYVLGGYSQGAQVIGQALPEISKEIRDRIAYVGLFGDPKLHFPEGAGGNKSAACRGKEISKWRRGLSRCQLESGSLGARKPYLPSDMTEKTGLWCNFRDIICDPFTDSSMDSHREYKSDGRGIDEAAQEAAAKLKLIFAEAGTIGQSIDISLSTGMKTTGRDTVFLIDTTGSMEDIIERTKTFARTSADKIKAGNGRVALVAFRDKGDEYDAKIVSRFEDSYATFQSGLDSLVTGGGGDWPEATLHALMTAMNGLHWRPGATKAAVVLTNSTFHNPDPIDNSTIRTVAKRSLEIDPVNIFPVVTSDLANKYQELASATSGQVIIDSGDTAEALSTAFDKIQERPVALLKNTEYHVGFNQGITLDASDSYVIGGRITKYEWDFNGDNIFDLVTDNPVFNSSNDGTSTDTTPYTGIIQLRVTADNGLIANTSATLTVASIPDPMLPSAPTNLSYTVVSTSNGKSTVDIKWDANSSVDQWYIQLNDTPLGHVSGNQTSLRITDVARSEAVAVSVAGHKTNVGTGAPSTVTIPAAPQQEPPILSTCTQANIFMRVLCKAIALLKIIISGITYYLLPWAV